MTKNLWNSENISGKKYHDCFIKFPILYYNKVGDNKQYYCKKQNDGNGGFDINSEYKYVSLYLKNIELEGKEISFSLNDFQISTLYNHMALRLLKITKDNLRYDYNQLQSLNLLTY